MKFYVDIKPERLQTRYIINSLITCTGLKIFGEDICPQNNEFQVCLFMRRKLVLLKIFHAYIKKIRVFI